MKLWVTHETLQQKEFLVEFLITGLAWDIRNSDLTSISTKREFLERHVQNARSPLRITSRILNYSARTQFALASINDQYCSDRLLNFLAYNHSVLKESFKAHTQSKTQEILSHFFYQFYESEIAGVTIIAGLPREQQRKVFVEAVEQRRIIKDYIEMVLDNDQYPNLRIKSYKRLVTEHDQLANKINLEKIPIFNIADPGILPLAKNEYCFELIGTKERLMAEAQEMQHCVASYADEIIDGSSVIYSISGKERATAEFFDFGEGYRLAQVSSYRNKVVSKELTSLLEQLTSHCQLKAPVSSRAFDEISLNSIFPPSNKK